MALVQRFQLDALHRALQSLEGHLAALESESRRPRRTDAWNGRLADLRDKACLPRPSGQPPTDTRTRAAPQPSTAPPTILPPPDPGEDWEEYTHNVERYIADHGIEESPGTPSHNSCPRIAQPTSGAGSTPSFAPRRGIAGTTASSRWPCSSAR